ncbi:MAG: DUF368 domain-containing protein [Acetatifactor sp.]|nr:DUF368 domain-containing protein [Acetatifactor sp.]
MEKKTNWWKILGKAMAIGGTMTVPGASGGTMAMILGIYEDLITAVGNLPGLLADCLFSKDLPSAGRKQNTPKMQNVTKLQKIWKSLRFLALFCVGALAGMALLARGVLTLLERYPVVVSYFFLGAVAGGIPLICRRAKVKKMTWQVLFWPLTGLFIVYSLAALPEGLFAAGLSGDPAHFGLPSLSQFLFQILGGCILAIALILPGISVSQMLLMLGLYEPVMEAVSRLHLVSLIPLGLGAVLCTLLVTRLLGEAMDHHPQPTYLLILGFVLGSLGELYPGLPTGWNLLFAPLAAAAGYQLLSCLSRKL